MWSFDQDNLGEFQERDHGKWFTYRATTDEWAILNNLPFEIDVLDGVRYARILETVAYIAVDEDGMGLPVLEKWSLKTHNHFEIDVQDGVRYARILETVAYIAVDEDGMGLPVLEKWSLKTHNHFEVQL